MPNLKNVVVVGDGPIKDAPALHGADLGYVWGGYNVELTIDLAGLHDGWVPITNPLTWKETGKQGWIKYSRVAVIDLAKKRYLITIDEEGAPTITRVG